MSLSASIVVPSRGNIEHLRRCLTYLAALRTAPTEIIVVDAVSADCVARAVTVDFPQVRVLSPDPTSNNAPSWRQAGFAAATGDIVVFTEDDAYSEADWLDELLRPYANDLIVGVGGRVRGGIAGEDTRGLGDVGRLLPDGRLTDNFAVDTGKIIEVSHLPGASMSFRRDAIEAIGGIPRSYPGTGVCEDSAISLQVGRGRNILVFTPFAVTTQPVTIQPVGQQRLDRRALYYWRRNHVVMLVQVFGWGDPIVRHFAKSVWRDQRGYLWTLRGRFRRTRSDGTPRPLSRRLSAPIVLTWMLAELIGLAGGFAAATRALHRNKSLLRTTADKQ